MKAASDQLVVYNFELSKTDTLFHHELLLESKPAHVVALIIGSV